MPACAGEPVSDSTRSGKASPLTSEPSVETTCPLHSRMKSRLRLSGGVGKPVFAPAPAKPAPPLFVGSVQPTPLGPAPAPAKPAPPLFVGSVEPTPLGPAPAPAKPAPPLLVGSVEPTPISRERGSSVFHALVVASGQEIPGGDGEYARHDDDLDAGVG